MQDSLESFPLVEMFQWQCVQDFVVSRLLVVYEQGRFNQLVIFCKAL